MRVSYHIFPNLGELLQRDLGSKIGRNLASNYFLDRECNCNTTNKVKGRWAYGGECRRCCVIYKLMCKWCRDFYVGNTQNTLKIMKQHFQDVVQKFTNNKNSESFADPSLNILRKNQVHNNVVKLCLSV